MVVDPSFKDDLASFYNAQALERERRSLRPGRSDLRNRFIRRLQREGRTTLIDLGAGTGHDAVGFSVEAIHVTAIDLSAEHVALCRSKGIDAHVGDFYNLGFPNGTFQAGWAMSSLLHVPDRDLDKVLAEIARVLEPRAPLAIGLWGGVDREDIWEDDIAEPKRFFSLRTDDRLRDLLRKRFEILEFESISTSNVSPSWGHYQWCVVTPKPNAEQT